ncbi:MAG: ATP-binding protein, partial [Lachnospiraceae bacterium]|nr:ATP-binding protein [Lachnospiraceae bacterium]
MAKNPYTMLFGKEPKQVIPRFSESSVIIDNFCEEEFSEQMYIITGVRGSGKTVFMSEIANALEQRKEWITVELNSESELLKDLASKLSSEHILAEIFKNANINLSFFGFGLEVSGTAPITNIETAVTKMLESIKKHKKRLLITIDEVVNSKHMSEF